MLLEHIGQHLQENEQADQAQIFLTKSRKLNQQASNFQRIAINHESPSTEKLEQPQAADD